MIEEKIPINVCVRTLLCNGYSLRKAKRTESYIILHTVKHDIFGMPVKYSFVFFNVFLAVSIIKTIKQVTDNEHSNLIFVGIQKIEGYISYTWQDFFARIGGAITNTIVFDPNIKSIVCQLGHNALPDGLLGNPDTLFEELIHQILKFIIIEPVTKYGQNRRFEPITDGVVFLDKERQQVALYDCKAYKDGYDISLESIRCFADYIKEFDDKYNKYGIKVYSFLVISGTIKNDKSSLEKRRQELYKKAKVQLVAMSAEQITNTVSILLQNITIRKAINWMNIFANTNYNSNLVKKSIQEIKKDGILEE